MYPEYVDVLWVARMGAHVTCLGLAVGSAGSDVGREGTLGSSGGLIDVGTLGSWKDLVVSIGCASIVWTRASMTGVRIFMASVPM